MSDAGGHSESSGVLPVGAMGTEAHRNRSGEDSRVRAGHPFEAVQSLVYLLIVALFVMTFTIQPFRIPSESMDPTLLVGDFLLVRKQMAGLPERRRLFAPDRIDRGDVIVFHYPLDSHIHLVKRVVGLPGERLHLHEGRVYINDVLLEEGYAAYDRSPPDEYRDEFPQMDRPNPAVSAAWWARMRKLLRGGELVVPPGSYFVMGDNRNNSEDSRYWGLVPEAAIVGKALVIYFSLRESHLARASEGDSSRLVRWDRMLKVVR